MGTPLSIARPAYCACETAFSLSVQRRRRPGSRSARDNPCSIFDLPHLVISKFGQVRTLETHEAHPEPPRGNHSKYVFTANDDNSYAIKARNGGSDRASRSGVCAKDARVAVDAYLLEGKARRLSEFTLRRHRWALDKLVAACPTLPESVDAIIELQASQDFPSSESHYDLWRTIKTFYKWASKRYDIPNVMLDVPAPQRDDPLPRTLETNDIEHLLSTTDDQRDFAMIVLILDTGMRLGDVANLQWPHIQGNRVLLVKGKGGKQRRVYIRPETRAALEGLGDGVHIWISDQPGRRYGKPIGIRGVQQAIKRVLRRAGFYPPKAGPHMLRHTYGRHFIRNGGSLPHLQRILGHSQVRSTQIYVTLNDEDLEQPQFDFSPIAGLIPDRRKEGKQDDDVEV